MSRTIIQGPTLRELPNGLRFWFRRWEKWAYEVARDIVFTGIRTGVPEGKQRILYSVRTDKKPRLKLAVVTSNSVTVYKGYAWDGATRAPSFDRVLRATLIHDLGCQFQNNEDFHFEIADRALVDEWFKIAMREDKFRGWVVYWGAVSLYRPFASRWEDAGIEVSGPMPISGL